MVLIDIPFITNEAEYRFMCSGSFGYLLLLIACSSVLHIILLGCLSFYDWESLYILYMGSFTVMYLTNILYHFVVVPFSVVMKIVI